MITVNHEKKVIEISYSRVAIFLYITNFAFTFLCGFLFRLNTGIIFFLEFIFCMLIVDCIFIYKIFNTFKDKDEENNNKDIFCFSYSILHILLFSAVVLY
jgi:heme O synthase-like polyprenyltransferase